MYYLPFVQDGEVFFICVIVFPNWERIMAHWPAQGLNP